MAGGVYLEISIEAKRYLLALAYEKSFNGSSFPGSA